MNWGIKVLQTSALPLGYVAPSSPDGLNSINWLGEQDSNLRMTESESVALPLGDTPTSYLLFEAV